MPIDFDQLLLTLVDETQENLADMDVALLTIDPDKPDIEKINQIFRIAHTIKGNSALFKLSSLKELMHTIETFLDEVRKGTKIIEKKQIELLLKISDGIRVILTQLQNKKTLNETLISDLKSSFEKSLQPSFETNLPSIKQKMEKRIQHSFLGWHISIRPKQNLFRNNLDIIPALKMLAEEVEFQNIDIIDRDLPPFETFDPLICYIGWEIDIIGDITKRRLLDILTWIIDEKDLVLTKITKEEITSATKPEIVAAQDIKRETPNTVRISTQKIDSLMNSVGELIIIESMLKQAIQKIDLKNIRVLDEPLNLLDSQFRYLQETVLRIRMVPIAFAINRFPRMVFEISNQIGKQVDFVIQGDQTEIDKNLIEKMTDPLLHIIRNAIDHGIESPEIREKIGKNKTGSLQFVAYQEKNNIIIEIKDDGPGIDPKKIKAKAIEKGLLDQNNHMTNEELYQFIFKPGFSTAETVTEYSGRGVGLDVVEKNIRSLGGTVQVHSILGKGTTFTLKLPLTLAIMESQLIRVQDQTFIIPLLNIIEMTTASDNISFENGKSYYLYKDQKIPIISLEKALHKIDESQNLKEKIIILVQTNYGIQALSCDELLIQQSIVIKTLEDNFCKIPGIIGATILGDGKIGLILDVNELVEIYHQPDICPAEVLQFFSRKFAFPHSEGEAKESYPKFSSEEISYELLCFALGNNEYAINMHDVQEINLSKDATKLPFTPPYLTGVINLRGSIIPVVDLRLFFNVKIPKSRERGIFIITKLEYKEKRKIIALVVDAITDTQSINRLDICPIPKAAQLLLRHYIQGLVYINERIITLLKVQRLVESAK